MDQVISDTAKIIATLANLFQKDGLEFEFKVLSEGSTVIEIIETDNWNGGTDIYGFFCKVPIDLYSEIERSVSSIESNIKKKASGIFRGYPQSWVGAVVVSPEMVTVIPGKSYKVSTLYLTEELDSQKNLMIAVSTGGPKIQDVIGQYKTRQAKIKEGLTERNLINPNPFDDFWAWYGRWSDGTLDTYQSRRQFLGNMFGPLIEELKKSSSNSVIPVLDEPTGWIRLDRTLGEIKIRLVQSSNEEQYQVIGLLSRDALITLAQSVYDRSKHPMTDGIVPSDTDAKRMLDAYILAVLPGGSNENIRRHAKASLDLANELTHRRTADFRQAALCAEATNSVISLIAIISGRRDRK